MGCLGKLLEDCRREGRRGGLPACLTIFFLPAGCLDDVAGLTRIFPG